MKKLTIIFIFICMLSISIFPNRSKDDLEKDIKLFWEALQNIQQNYVNDIEFKELIYFAIDGILNGLDPHSSLLRKKEYEDLQRSSTGSYGGVGMSVSVENNVLTCVSPIEDSPAFRLGIKSGDQIIKIDGLDTAKMKLEDAVSKLRGTPGTSVRVSIYRPSSNEYLEFNIVREIIKLISVKYQRYDDIGYIKLFDFKQTSAKEIRDAINALKKEKVKGYILDLRNNPGGLLSASIEVSDLFLERNLPVVSVKGRSQSEDFTYFSKSNPLINEPLIILINEGSASASEIVAGAVKDHKRGIVIGEKSFGKGSVQRLFPLSDGSAIKLTIAKYYTPLNISIHGTGIEPDILVHRRNLTGDEIKTIEMMETGKYIEDYLKEIDAKIKSLEKMSSSFERTRAGFEKLTLETYSMNVLNIISFENKLKGNNINISRPLLIELILRGIEKQKHSDKEMLIDPIMDQQISNAINILKTMLWKKS